MGYIVLQGSLSFENYSQTQIKLTFDSGYSVVDYFFDKRLVKIPIPDNPLTAEQLLIIPGVGPEYPNVFQFAYPEVILPVTSSVDEFRNIINSWLYTGGPQVSVSGGTLVGPLNTINLIEGTNITITAVDNLAANSVDVTIDASGGGGGLPPDGTYGDVVVSGTGTVWTVTDDTSNQQVAVYEDAFLRGTRPSLNFYDDGGLVSITVADNPGNNRVDIEITSTGIGTVTAVTATGLLTSSGGTTPDISSQVNKGKLIGRNSVTDGVMEEITVGSGLSLSGTTLNASVNGSITHATATGTDTYAATITGVTSYADGDCYLIRFTNGNTTGATININGLGAVNLYRNNDGPVIGGDIQALSEMLLVYNATTSAFQCIGTSPNTIIAYVTNADSVSITKGMPVYAFGGTGDRMTVKRAYNTTDATSAQTVGLVFSSSIAANQKGFIMLQGLLDGLSILPTSTWADGDTVYLGATAGTITNVKPYAPNHLVYLGVVTTASPGAAGRMYVRVQNGYELDELHNVQAQSPSNNNTLYYDSSVSQWKTASIATILGYAPVSPALLINTTAPLTGGGNLSADRTLAINQSTTAADGYLSSTNWNTFNGKATSPWEYRLSGRFYTPSNNALSIGSLGNLANGIRYSPVIIERDITITQLGISVVTIAAVGNTARVGIYSNNPSTNQPLNRLVDSGTIALDGVANSQRIVTGLSVALTKGLYWFAYFSNASTGTVASIANSNLPDVIGTTGTLNNGLITGYFQTLTYTNLPATASGLGTISSGASSYCIYYYY